ncbi:site-specific integrase [Actinobacillus porcinus]
MQALLSIKPVTWNNYMRHLHSLFNFGMKKKLVPQTENPFSGLMLKLGKKPKKTLTEKQLSKIATVLNDEGRLPDILQPAWFMRCLIDMLKYTAIRRGQLLKLKIEHIDLDKKLLFIPSDINKTHNYHQIPLSKHLIPSLTYLIQELRKQGLNKEAQLFNLNRFSFYTRDCKRDMTDDQLSHVFKVLSKLVGFSVSPHRFRHTVATNLMKNPQNLYITKQLLGHSNISVTLEYIEYDAETLRSSVDNL